MKDLDLPPFEIAEDGVDPEKVPKIPFKTGARLPVVGLGTFGSDHVEHERMARAVYGALQVGYRHFDCAAVYGNEDLIGIALERAMDAGIKRKELWITSKLWNDKHDPKDVIPACEQTLKDLRLDYLDLYLVHWPFPNSHPPGCDGDTRSPDARPYIHEEYMATWRKMEELLDLGLVKHIGTSNMSIPKMELLLRDASIKPVVNEMEIHPYFQQPEFVSYLMERSIIPIAYSPIGSPQRPERDRTPEDPNPLEDPLLKKMAEEKGISIVELIIKWHTQRGYAAIPFSTNRKHYLSNLKASLLPDLTEEEMKQIASIDKNARLIKGQVFLWKPGQSWEDLWDPHGYITPP